MFQGAKPCNLMTSRRSPAGHPRHHRIGEVASNASTQLNSGFEQSYAPGKDVTCYARRRIDVRKQQVLRWRFRITTV